MAKRKLNNNAHQKPSTLNPVNHRPARRMIRAFITNKNNPKVTTVTGKVSKISTGRRVALRNANSMATKRASRLSETCTPFKSMLNSKTDTADINMRAIINFI